LDTHTQSIKKLYYSIGEVSKVTELKQYVLRYWETEFKQLNPSKNKAGNRTYRQKDIDLILRIKDLLYNQKFTIEGARKMLSGVEAPTVETALESEAKTSVDLDLLIKIRGELKSILEHLRQK
jgi:DNA-binding transcriptional MerR regulator